MLRSSRALAVSAVALLVSSGLACGSFGGSDASPAAGTSEGGAGDAAVGDGDAVPDAAAPVVGDPCPDAGAHRFMFVTNQTFRGDLGRAAGSSGRAAADQLCKDAAVAAGLPGTYVAWLSTTVDHPNVAPQKGVAIVLPRACEVLAADSIALTATTKLTVAPSSTELGGTLAGPCYVWSNTTVNGTSQGADTCSDWASADSGLSGAVGMCDSLDYEWSTWGVRTCDNGNVHLYCLQN